MKLRFFMVVVVLVGACDGSIEGSEEAEQETCDELSWDTGWTAIELEVLDIVNQNRAQGADCGSEGTFGPTQALTSNGILSCAARLHSQDMSTRDYFSHTNPDGDSPFDRMEEAGYEFNTAGENIAAGQGTASAVMAAWMGSDGHCSNVMNPNFTEIGIGYFPTGGPYWTQNFGRPR